MRKKLFVVTLIMSLLYWSGSTAVAGNIDANGHQYSWGENAGWFNFEPALGPGVTVSNDFVIGAVWAENIGWVYLGPLDFGGVTNDGAGNLAGHAWGENVGWISFSCENTAPCGSADYGVTIDSDGLFHGYAWAENIGWINFELSNQPESVVKTSWGTASNDCVDNDGDGYVGGADCSEPDDCDDDNPDVHPGAPDNCTNGIDDDCDGLIDEYDPACTSTFAEEITFDGLPGSAAVTLAWTAVSEEDVLGYNIFRKVRNGGAWVQINDMMIAGKGSIETTVDYEFVDDGVRNRRTYQYMLVEVETDGNTKQHGPVSATPRLIYGIGK